MKKIAIVTFNCALNGEKGLDRLYFLANLYSKNGYKVELITSRFNHWTKNFRDKNDNFSMENLKIIQCDELGYEKNIQVKRIVSHWILAKNILNYMQDKVYDVIYCHIPDNHLAALVSSYSKRNKIPCIIDIEDLWPEAMRMVFNVPVLSDIIFYYFSRDAKIAFANASAVIGSSDEYRDHPEKYGVHIDNKLTVYVGNDLERFDRAVNKFSDKIFKPKNKFWVIYAGTLGTSYDIATLIKAAQILKSKEFDDIEIKVLGDGPEKENFIQLSKKQPCNIEFLGYRSYEYMAAYLTKGDVNINSLVRKAPQGFVSKIGDYLASGKPMINTGSNEEFKKAVAEEGWGINVPAENPEQLAKIIYELRDCPTKCKEMGNKARLTAEKKYNRNYSYLNIIKLTDDLIKDNN